MNTLSLEDLNQGLFEFDLINYHEAGHVVAFYLLGFPPVLIDGALSKHDARSTAFLRTRNGMSQTPLARERVQDYAVASIAGIAAESKFSGVPIADLRQTAGKGDYDAAITDYTTAISFTPWSEEYYLDRAKVYKAKGDVAGANADIEAAQRLSSEK